MQVSKQKKELTFKHNLQYGRHGWLRLTPAYSIKLVGDILEANPNFENILDPFCGTGTTGLVSAERGINCDLLEINPFLVWFAKIKTSNYDLICLIETKKIAQKVISMALAMKNELLWVPSISHIERWWTVDRLSFLAKLYCSIHAESCNGSPINNLLMVAFCRILIEISNAAFNHQSMSFKEQPLSLFSQQEEDIFSQRFLSLVNEIVKGAQMPVNGKVRVIHADSRHVPKSHSLYDAVITSPPYPNRMSYIRELRPYMYWTGFLTEARQAAELDWQAIGGTWGAATSWLQKWSPNGIQVCHIGFEDMIQRISSRSELLANYVHKYFIDTTQHIAGLFPSLASNARVFYIVGNSKFYDTVVPVEQIYASIFEQQGFINIEIEPIRKRNSKKELFEFCIKAQKP